MALDNTPRKKLRDTKVGQWLRSTAPKVLDVVGDVLPDSGVLGIVKNLVDLDDGDEGSEETRGRRKRIKEAREDRSITIPGLDEPETGVKNPGIEEL